MRAPCKKPALATELGKPSRLFPTKVFERPHQRHWWTRFSPRRACYPSGNSAIIRKWHDRLNQIDAWRAQFEGLD